MMSERNIVGGVAATILSGFFEFAGPLKWLLLLGGVLIVVDLRFGIRASRKRGEAIRWSRAVRRTANKAVDYICWLLLAGSLGSAFGESLGTTVLPVIVMLVIYGVELNSCFSNYFEAKGSGVKVNVFNFFSKKTDIIEVEEKTENQFENHKKRPKQ